jgi:hypothetical protein
MWPRESATSAPPITAASSEATPGLTLRSCIASDFVRKRIFEIPSHRAARLTRLEALDGVRSKDECGKAPTAGAEREVRDLRRGAHRTGDAAGGRGAVQPSTRRSVPGSGFVPRIHARAWVQRHRRQRRYAKGSALSGGTSRPAGGRGPRRGRPRRRAAQRPRCSPAGLSPGRPDRPADVVHALDGKPLGEVVGTPATAVP